MTDLRENLGWVIGGVLAAIAAFLGWFYESGLLNTVIGVAIGVDFYPSYLTRKQWKVWFSALRRRNYLFPPQKNG